MPEQPLPNQPARPTARPYISPSQIESYSRCGEAYRRRYLEKEIIPPGIAALKGKGMHHGASVNFQQKIESHVDLPVSEIVDASVAGFEQSLAKDQVLFTPEEESRGKSVVIAECKDQTANLAAVHAQLQAPDYQPTHTERPVLVPLPSISHDLYGVIDFIDDKHRVGDFKTAGKSKAQSDADSSVQLTYYAAAKQVLDGIPASEVRLDTLVQKKKTIDRQVLVSHRAPADFQVLANRINAMLHGLKAGVFTPATPGAWWCSERFCGYASTCPYFSTERKDFSRGDE